MRSKEPAREDLVALARAAAAEAADYQDRYAAEDTEARKIVDVMERFLRARGRVVYGGAAINAHLSAEHKFYDPALYLPDYDFMTPDPLQDAADLIATFEQEGFTEVEAKFGIHEGTYKIFVNYRSAADITYMPPTIYERVVADADTIDGIRYASVNFLRMNMYLELSRPAGDVKRWEKVYERLLLLNEEHPLRPGRCVEEPLAALGVSTRQENEARATHDALVGIGIAASAVFLSGAAYLVDREPRPDEPVLLLTDRRAEVVESITARLGLRPTESEAAGELLPARTELRSARGKLLAVVFDTMACHSYTTLPQPAGYRLGSLDLLIQMYYAMYFNDLQGYLPVRLLCVIHELIEMEAARRRGAAAGADVAPHDVFPLECIGHQPTMPELKKAHRARVRARRKELVGALQTDSVVRRRTRRRRSSTSRSNRKASTRDLK